MDPGQEPVTLAGDRPTVRRRAWIQVGLISAVLWVVIGLVVGYVSTQLGTPTLSGWLALLTGPVVLRIVGRREHLDGSWAWTQAGLFQLGVVILAVSVALYAAVVGGFLGPADPSTIEAVSFGTGGADCDIPTPASTFVPTDTIRAAAEFFPVLPVGTHVTIWLSREGREVEGSRETLILDAPAGCVSGRVSDTPLAAGHYRWEASPDDVPEAIGEFDVR